MNPISYAVRVDDHGQIRATAYCDVCEWATEEGPHREVEQWARDHLSFECVYREA